MNRKKFSNDQDAVEYLYPKDIDDNIAIPPDVDELTTDEEEIDDDNDPIIKDIKIEIITDDECDQTDLPSPSESKTKKLKIETPKVVFERNTPNYTNWSETEEIFKDCLMAMQTDLGNASPVDIFEKFFSNEVYDLIVQETIRYAKNVKNDHDFKITTEDIKIFIGFLIFSGYHTLPSERDYWSEAEDLGIGLVQKAFTRNAYQKIKTYIHFQDNSTASENTHDKSFKIRPLLEKVNENFKQWGIFNQYLSIDEMLVRYYGHHSLKQLIRAKPVCSGYKLWAMCGDSGYCYKFSLYCGKEESENQALGSQEDRVVMNMLSIVENPSNHIIFLNNFFNNHLLMHNLQEKGFKTTGTIKDNRTDKCTIKSSKELDKMQHDTYDFRFDEQNESTIVRCNDNKSMAVATNFDNTECISKVHRWSNKNNEKVTSPQPNLINTCNKHMGGVDYHNWLLEKYSIAIRGKKWYWCLFTRIVDMALVNSSLLYRNIHGYNSTTMKDFRRAIAVKYLKLGIGRKVLKSRPHRFPSTSKINVNNDVRYDRIDHNIGRRNAQRRCRFEGCQARPLTFCVKCNVTLCKNCFTKFHTKL